MSERYDTIFSLPSVDDDPDTEVGVLLMGLAPDRLLAGLGVATRDPAADPATVTLLVDQLRHDARPGLTFSDAVAAGAQRWRVACEGSVDLGSGTRSAALRQLWESTARAVAAAGDEFPQLSTNGAAERVYLTACWSRPEEITKIAEECCPT
ncbi:DUF6187 family protein [Actinophytocola sp.]|uniref:DUF6187 family protein n=1 Tax=Actinophytocola sp. TaxID=1872138 RepID=UPI002ED38EF0